MTITPDNLKSIIEALLMASDEALDAKRIRALLSEEKDGPSLDEVKKALLQLQQDYLEKSFDLVETANGFSFRVKQDYAPWVAKLWELKPPRYSRALYETLALIAYKQPITRAEIEEVRGVAVSSHTVKTLMERDWVKIIGHKDLPGKPALLATTKTFLDYFNLKSLTDLPSLQALQDLDKAGEQMEIELKLSAEQSEGEESNEQNDSINENESNENHVLSDEAELTVIDDSKDDNESTDEHELSDDAELTADDSNNDVELTAVDDSSDANESMDQHELSDDAELTDDMLDTTDELTINDDAVAADTCDATTNLDGNNAATQIDSQTESQCPPQNPQDFENEIIGDTQSEKKTPNQTTESILEETAVD